jgi:hypothetical protein
VPSIFQASTQQPTLLSGIPRTSRRPAPPTLTKSGLGVPTAFTVDGATSEFRRLTHSPVHSDGGAYRFAGAEVRLALKQLMAGRCWPPQVRRRTWSWVEFRSVMSQIRQKSLLRPCQAGILPVGLIFELCHYVSRPALVASGGIPSKQSPRHCRWGNYDLVK